MGSKDYANHSVLTFAPFLSHTASVQNCEIMESWRMGDEWTSFVIVWWMLLTRFDEGAGDC